MVLVGCRRRKPQEVPGKMTRLTASLRGLPPEWPRPTWPHLLPDFQGGLLVDSWAGAQEVIYELDGFLDSLFGIQKCISFLLSYGVANRRTSIGMLVGIPPDPGAAEIRPAMA